MQATYQAKIPDKGIYPLLDAMAALYGRAERALFVDHHVRGRALSECKRESIRNCGLTARQFNALRASLDGKVEAAREGQKNRIAHLQDTIAAAKKAARKAERDLAKLRKKKARGAQAASMQHRLRFTLHQKRRRLHTLERRLAAARADHEAGRVRLCFGGKKLFHAQFHRDANGFADLAAWQAAWRKRRSSQFLCLGSKDESAGNQTCTRMPDGALRLRVPPGLEAAFGKHVLVKDVKFTYGQAEIDAALRRGEAVTYRFLRRDDQEAWYVHASVERPAAKITTDRRLGALGVDFNPAHVEVGRDRPFRESRGGVVLSPGPGQEDRRQGDGHPRGSRGGHRGLGPAFRQAPGGGGAGLPEEEGRPAGEIAPLRPDAVGLRLSEVLPVAVLPGGPVRRGGH